MSKGFTTFRLVQDGSASPVLEKQVAPSFHHLHVHSPGQDSQVLLQSGFNGLNQDSQISLSPALQLNGDIAGLEDKSLRLFAEAERIRKNQTTYSSYTVEPDNRICLISDNASSLGHFFDTYGGVLDIVPILQKGSHPDFIEATELDISYHENRYRIEYSVRSPVDSKKCSYCGLCGSECPEECISEKLFFDFEACTFCRECERICPVGAIDIYAVEQNTLEIPALLILGETEVKLPDNAQNHYDESDLEKFLSAQFPSQVDEVISCNHTICQFSSRTDAGCDECIRACSFGAISGEEQIVINPFKCVECGGCAGVCPTGAIVYHRFEDSIFSEFFRTYPLETRTMVVIGPEEELHRFWWQHRGSRFDNHLFLEFPRSDALSAFHLMFLLAHGASHVTVLKSDKKSNSGVWQAIDRVNGIIKTVFEKNKRVHLSTPKEYPSLAVSFEEDSPLLENFCDFNYINRRQNLSSIFSHAIDRLEKTITFKSDSSTLFHSIVCEEAACTQCLACLNECRIQALSSDPSSLTLCWNGALCTGCNACVHVCPEKALSSGNEVSLNPSFFAPAVAAQAEPMRCKGCGKVFGTKKSFDRVMEILAKQKMDHDGHFEYCEDCRVIKLFESE